MFCPKCAAQNQDQTKFCRSCGTDLKTVALVLSGQLNLPLEVSNTEEKKRELIQEWLERQTDGVHSVIRGALLFGTSVLIGAALGLFSNQPDWTLIWLIFCGWLAVWGAISLGEGFSNLIQSRMLRRNIDRLAAAMTAQTMPVAVETRKLPETAVAPEESTPSSVTEQTTASLGKPHPRV